MKNNILKSFLAFAVIISAVGCEEPDYNEMYLDGYEVDPEITDIQTFDITLTSDDYETITELDTNVYLASKAGTSTELAAVATNEYFTANITAGEYVPALLQDTYGEYLSVGSKINVTFNNFADSPEELANIMAATEYTVTSDDYASVWGDDVSANYFTPSESAASNLATILKSALPEAVEGDYAVVAYNYSSQEPSVDGESSDDPSTDDSTTGGDSSTDVSSIVLDGDSGFPAEGDASDTSYEVGGIELQLNVAPMKPKWSHKRS